MDPKLGSYMITNEKILITEVALPSTKPPLLSKLGIGVITMVKVINLKK